jgi:hypothetical protein
VELVGFGRVDKILPEFRQASLTIGNLLFSQFSFAAPSAVRATIGLKKVRMINNAPLRRCQIDPAQFGEFDQPNEC